MFKQLDRRAGRRLARGDTAILVCSATLHLLALAVLPRLPDPPPTERTDAEVISFFEVAPQTEPERTITERPPGRFASQSDAPAPPVTIEGGVTEIEAAPFEIPAPSTRLALPAGLVELHQTPDAESGMETLATHLDSVTVFPAPIYASIAGTDLAQLRLPRLRNKAFIIDLLSRYYPRRLEIRRITGSVTLRFLIDERGVVDATTVRLLNTDQDEFGVVALALAPRFRFFPALHFDKPVPVAVEMPITWNPGQ